MTAPKVFRCYNICRVEGPQYIIVDPRKGTQNAKKNLYVLHSPHHPHAILVKMLAYDSAGHNFNSLSTIYFKLKTWAVTMGP